MVIDRSGYRRDGFRQIVRMLALRTSVELISLHTRSSGTQSVMNRSTLRMPLRSSFSSPAGESDIFLSTKSGLSLTDV